MLFWHVFRLTPVGPVTITRMDSLPAGGAFLFGDNPQRNRRIVPGGVPEWLKGTDCKSVGSAYVGSNPTPSTSHPRGLRV